MRIKSFAKVNLGLEVRGRRQDGYHDIKTLFQTISLADELTLNPEESGAIRLSGNDPAIPWDASNLVSRAARALKDRYPGTPGVRIEVTKFIPAGKGLGGGSSNAAMTLWGLSRFWGLTLGKEGLMDIGRSLGADVPYFLEGGLCLGLDRGDRIVQLDDLPVLYLVIALPPFSCSTADIYRHHKVALTSLREESKIDRFFRKRDLRFLENGLEATVFRFHPQLKDIKGLFRSLGSELSLVSGSGSAVFGVFSDRLKAEEAWRRAEREYPAVLAETVTRERFQREVWAGV